MGWNRGRGRRGVPIRAENPVVVRRPDRGERYPRHRTPGEPGTDSLEQDIAAALRPEPGELTWVQRIAVRIGLVDLERITPDQDTVKSLAETARTAREFNEDNDLVGYIGSLRRSSR